MTNKIEKLTFNEKSLLRGNVLKDRREQAVTDLLKENSFSIKDRSGPFIVDLEISQNRLIIIATCNQGKSEQISFSLSPLKKTIKDYSIICDSYFDAVKFADPKKVETIDMGRRGIHNEGAEIIDDLISDQACVDFDTARKFFTIIYLLQVI